jgi:PHD/YefM family antitoxin component YafN of YafNO toxin-antitoxin module
MTFRFHIIEEKHRKGVFAMDQLSTLGMMKKIVPITRFNKGEANKIFDEVQMGGPKIVMKNNRPACVLLSPEQYESMIEMLSDSLLLAEAEQRMAANDDTQNLSHEEMMQSLGITQDELDAIDVEIEE